MSIKKYTDWSTWWDGMRTNMIKAGATSVASNLSVYASTNVTASLQIPGLSNSGEGWKTLIIGLFAQFILHTVYAAAVYMQNNQPQVVIKTEETQHITKDPATGEVTTGSSKTTTTTVSPTVESKPQ